jgi:glutaredoxin-like YruB-family protein
MSTNTKTKRQPTVVVFTTPTCSWCRVVKQHLKKHKIRFKEIDVTKDERAARDMVRRTGQQGVPVTLIRNRPIVGFKKEEINRLLDIRER